MKKVYISISALLLCANLSFAQTPANRTAKTIAADVLAQMPAEQQAEYNKQISELSAAGEEAVFTLINMINAPGKGSNAKVDYALSGLSHFVMAKGQENARQVVAKAYIQALDKVPCREQEGISDWMVVCSEIRENLQAVDDALPERYPNRMIGELSDMLKDTGAIAVDVGQHMVWSYQSFKNREGQKLLFSGGHGAMGYALPAAIGAYYATGKPTACICGDGAFQMNIQELEWVKRENLPVKIMVMNNEALGMIRHLQRDYFDCLFAGTTDGCGFASCDFSKVAAAYGIPSCRMHCEDVKEEAPQFMEGPGPKLLEVMLEHGTFAYPKTCLGEPIHNQQPYAPKSVYDHLMAL